MAADAAHTTRNVRSPSAACCSSVLTSWRSRPASPLRKVQMVESVCAPSPTRRLRARLAERISDARAAAELLSTGGRVGSMMSEAQNGNS